MLHAVMHPQKELLNGEVFSSVPEAKVLTDAWRQHYNPPVGMDTFFCFR